MNVNINISIMIMQETIQKAKATLENMCYYKLKKLKNVKC